MTSPRSSNNLAREPPGEAPNTAALGLDPRFRGGPGHWVLGVGVRHDRDVIFEGDLDEARDRILLGSRDSSHALLPGEKRAVAIHEAGHALVALCSEHSDPVAKVTILPAGRSLGVTHQLPTDEHHLYSESYLHDSLAVRLGGRASQLLVLGEASTGASNDLAGATDLAVRVVRDWGFSPRLGPVGLGPAGPGYLGATPNGGGRTPRERSS